MFWIRWFEGVCRLTGRKSSHETLAQPSRLKIERAKKHVNDLNLLTNNFLSTAPFELWSRFKKKPYQRQVFVKQKEPIPDEISLILGDAVHNLKSALDILAFGMAGDKAPEPKRVLFPFSEKPDGLQGSIGNRQIALAGEKVVAAIKELQPYAGGDKYLYGIQTLDTRDKHHFIITTGQVAEVSGDLLGALTGMRISGPGILRANIPTGETILQIALDGTRQQRRAFKPFERKEAFQPPFKICFAPEQGGLPPEKWSSLK